MSPAPAISESYDSLIFARLGCIVPITSREWSAASGEQGPIPPEHLQDRGEVCTGEGRRRAYDEEDRAGKLTRPAPDSKGDETDLARPLDLGRYSKHWQHTTQLNRKTTLNPVLPPALHRRRRRTNSPTTPMPPLSVSSIRRARSKQPKKPQMPSVKRSARLGNGRL